MKALFAKIWKIDTLKILAAFLIPLLLVLLTNNRLDNDSWYVLSEGREIAENGVYYTDPLSMHDNLDVTVQNYGFAVIFYWIFNTFGAPGIYICTIALTAIISLLIYKICMLISDKNTNLSLLIMIITTLVLGVDFIVTRAQMVSYAFFLSAIYVLELYVKTGKIKHLIWLPLLSLLQINLHASLWWMLILILGVYIVDSFKNKTFHLQGYRTLPLIIAGIIMFLVALINPYGIKMITFIMTSYGNTRFHSLVVELSAFSPFKNVCCAITFMAIVATLTLYIFAKDKDRVRVRYLLMFFGFLALGMNTIKGLSQLILVMGFPLALLYKDVKLEKVIDSKKGRDALTLWGGIVCTAVFVVILPVVASSVIDYPSTAMVEAFDTIDADVAKNGGATNNVYTGYTGYNDGGYAEYRGYKPYIDPRGEVFLEKNNNKEDILFEWADFKEGKIPVKDFIDKYNFNYILTRYNRDPFFELNDERYELLYENNIEMVRVFKKKELVAAE